MSNTKRLQALKFAYRILTDKRNQERYADTCLHVKSTGEVMNYEDMLDTLGEIAHDLKEGIEHADAAP